MNIKAVLFDLGGVLFTLGEADYRREVARRLGLGAALPEAYDHRIPALQRGEASEQDLWAALSGRRVPTTAFDDAWLGYFHPIPAMFELARELRALGLKTAVLSNTQPSHVAIIRRLGLLDEFEPLVMSCEAGRRKPEPEVFRLVLDQLGLGPQEVVFVDDLPEFVEAARQVELHGILHSGDPEATRAAILALI